MRKIISIMLVTICLVCVGCTKHPDGWKKAESLDTYITNYNEVEDILCEQFNTDSVTLKQNDDICSEVDSLANFGNGHYFFTVNGVECSVGCEDHIAYYVYIDTLGSFNTPTRDAQIEEQMQVVQEQAGEIMP